MLVTNIKCVWPGVRRPDRANPWYGDDQHFERDRHTSGDSSGEDDCDCDDSCGIGRWLQKTSQTMTFATVDSRWFKFLCFKMIINCASQAALAGPLAASSLKLQDEDILMTADVNTHHNINNMVECWYRLHWKSISGNCFPIKAAHSQRLQIWT